MSELTTWSSISVSICFLLEILMADLRNLLQVSWKNRLHVQLVNGSHMLELLSHGNPTTSLPVYQTSKRYIRHFLRMLWQKGWGSNISASFCGNLSFPKKKHITRNMPGQPSAWRVASLLLSLQCCTVRCLRCALCALFFVMLRIEVVAIHTWLVAKISNPSEKKYARQSGSFPPKTSRVKI